MRIVGVVLVLETFVAREIWMWWGEGRLWLIVHGTLLGGNDRNGRDRPADRRLRAR
jgi:hypothetical protein